MNRNSTRLYPITNLTLLINFQYMGWSSHNFIRYQLKTINHNNTLATILNCVVSYFGQPSSSQNNFRLELLISLVFTLLTILYEWNKSIYCLAFVETVVRQYDISIQEIIKC